MGRSKVKKRCPGCGSKHVVLEDTTDDGISLYVCIKCDREFEIGGDQDDKFDDDFDYDDDPEFETPTRQSGRDDDDDEWN